MEEESNNGGEYNRQSQMEGVSQDGDYDGKTFGISNNF
jgi:hypothetical protein